MPTESKSGGKGDSLLPSAQPTTSFCPVVVSTGTGSPACAPAVSRGTIVRRINKTESEISGMPLVKEGQQGTSLQVLCQKPWPSLRGGRAIWKVTGSTFSANYWRLQAHKSHQPTTSAKEVQEVMLRA